MKIFSIIVFIISLIFAWLYFDDFKQNLPALIQVKEKKRPLVQGLIKLQGSLASYTRELGSVQNLVILTHLEDPELNKAIQHDLAKAFKTRKNGQYAVEVEIFNDLDPNETIEVPESSASITESKAEQDNKNINRGNIIFQFSIFEIKSSNKIGEFGYKSPVSGLR